MMHAAATSALTFGIARVFLGFGEAANFPACIKTVAEWFPKRQRGVATGIFNSGANIGAVATILLVPWMAEKYGWQSAFLSTGAIGFLWVGLWLWIYRQPEVHPKVSAEELALIRSDPPDKVESVPVAQSLSEERDLGVRRGQVLHRPHLVVLPFLAAQVSAGHVSPVADGHTDPDVDCLQRVDHRQRGRRLALVEA